MKRSYCMQNSKFCSSTTRGAFRRRSRLSKTYSWARGWVQSHCFGLLLCALPMVAIFANYSCTEITQGPQERDFFMQVWIYYFLQVSCSIHLCDLWLIYQTLTSYQHTVILFDNDRGCVSMRFTNKKLRPLSMHECRSKWTFHQSYKNDWNRFGIAKGYAFARKLSWIYLIKKGDQE